MTYYVLVTCLVLASFLSLNVLGTSVASLVWLGLRRRAQNWLASSRARFIFWLRVVPPVGALGFVLALQIPAYLTHEPYAAHEAVGLSLLLFALFSASGIALALYRAISSWLVTRRLMKFWMKRAEPVAVGGIQIPAYRLGQTAPVLAIVGTVRPRLFIAGQVMDSFSPEEMEMALAHERGHLLARDTFKRAVVNICRDLLPFVKAGRVLEQAWADEAEKAADEYAARSGGAGALDLAAALIKLARMLPTGVKKIVPAGAFLLDSTADGLGGRVRLLTELASGQIKPSGSGSRLSRLLYPAGFALFIVVSAALVADRHFLSAVHNLTETLIRLLA